MSKPTTQTTQVASRHEQTDAGFVEVPFETELPVELSVPMPAEFPYRATIPLQARLSLGARGTGVVAGAAAASVALPPPQVEADADDEDCGCGGGSSEVAAGADNPWAPRRKRKAVYGFHSRQMLAQSRAAEALVDTVAQLKLPPRIEVVQGLPDEARTRLEALEQGQQKIFQAIDEILKRLDGGTTEPPATGEASPCTAAYHLMLDLAGALSHTPLRPDSILETLRVYHDETLPLLYERLVEVVDADSAKLIAAHFDELSDAAAFRERLAGWDGSTAQLERPREKIVLEATRAALDFSCRCHGEAGDVAPTAQAPVADATTGRRRGKR